MAAINFDATTVDPTNPFATLPATDYRSHITASEVKPTNNGNGRYLQLEFAVLDGPYKGRKFWARLNIENPNKTAQDIAQRQLSALCHAAGVLKLTNTQQLHHIPVMVKLTVKDGDVKKDAEGKPIKDASGNVVRFDPRNEVKDFAKADGSAASMAPAPAAAAGAPAWAQARKSA